MRRRRARRHSSGHADARIRPTSRESVDPDEVSPSEPYRAWKQAGLLLLALAWIALGLVGHDPWKFDDATTFGVAWEMTQRGDFVVPQLAGEAYLPRPPLVPALAALAQHAAARRRSSRSTRRASSPACCSR